MPSAVVGSKKSGWVLRITILWMVALFSSLAQAGPPTSPRSSSARSEKASPSRARRGMWVWNSHDVLSQNKTSQTLLEQAQAIGVTDLYVYAAPNDYSDKKNAFAAFNGRAKQAGLRVWALDGARSYFADADGPAHFFEGISHLIAFNQSVSKPERFWGFQADNEPNDLDGHQSFHDGLTDAQLSRAPHSGVWQLTQERDRTLLMRSWLSMHQQAQTMLHDAGLKFGAAMPSWTSDYYGAPILVRFPHDAAPVRSVTEYMMDLVDEYVLMTYNVDPKNAANRALLQLQYASSLPAARRPRIYASVEVTKGVGSTISYGDTPGKDSKAVVLRDMGAISRMLSGYSAFGGLAIEQWSGWQELKP